MKLTRVKAYINGNFSGFEMVYFTENQAEALQRFRKEFPNMQNYILVAETLETEKDSDFIDLCYRCGSFR